MPGRPVDPTAVDAELDHVRWLGIAALRARWRTMFEGNPPAGLTKDMLARMIAYRLQEQAFGAFDRDAVKLLDRLARGERAGDLNRRLKPGTVLVREYNGKRHTVTIVPDGFVWQGNTYDSLSMIARAITGTAWNGPRFFGLRMPGVREGQGTSRQPPGPSSSRKTGREPRGSLAARRSVHPGQVHPDG